jgi:hypothetical protein
LRKKVIIDLESGGRALLAVRCRMESSLKSRLDGIGPAADEPASAEKLKNDFRMRTSAPSIGQPAEKLREQDHFDLDK